MKIKTKQAYYERRTKNVQKVEDAIKLLELHIKDSIVNFAKYSDEHGKHKIENDIDLYTNLLSGAVIIWCESLIKALFYEYGAFENEQINELLSKEKSLEQKWTLALTCAFFKAFSGQEYDPANPIANKNSIINLNTIAQSEKDKFTQLYDLIETRLVPAIKVRNKIQHGDWVFAFNEAKFERNSAVKTLKQKPFLDRHTTKKIKEENILTLKLKRNQFRIIYGLIKDLAVFKRYGLYRGDSNSTPFQNNFAKRYRQILSNQGLIDISNFEKYRDDLISSKQRGEIWKSKNKSLIAKIKTWVAKILNKIKY
jgi:hypothetical protein